MNCSKYRFFIFLLIQVNLLCSQELEPRAINNLPVGTNFLAAVYAYSHGNILLDPSVPIDDIESKTHASALGYVRSIDFFGLSGKVDVVVPYALGDWNGELNGSPDAITRNGFGDIRLRLSFNFIGSPALRGAEFLKYKPKLISGMSFQAILPTGQYDPSKLINLSGNRWALKTQWGIAQNFNKWSLEFYANIWTFAKNSNFIGGNELTQDPLFAFKTHLIRSLPNRMWVSANFGYAVGGKSYVNAVPRDTEISTARIGVFFAVPLNVRNTIRIGYISGFRFKQGSDYDAISLSYLYGWNKAFSKSKLRRNK